jgi:DNA polymerase-3 subunit delta'
MTAKNTKNNNASEKEEKVGQAYIYASESVELTHRMYLKSLSDGYKVALIWLPERMNEQCANKILKLLEEPPEKSVFLLVSEQPEKLLDTIRSRCRQIIVPPVATDEIKAAISAKFRMDDKQLAYISHSCAGDYIEACRLLTNSEQSEQFFEWFTVLTRNAVSRNVKGIKQWGDEMAKRGVDMQKQFLLYCARMIRENFIYNLNISDISYMNGAEQQFAVRFAPFITEQNCEPIINEINLALRHVEQNVNKKMVFFNLALQLTAYIKKQ